MTNSPLHATEVKKNFLKKNLDKKGSAANKVTLSEISKNNFFMKKSKMTEQEHETRSQFKKTSQHTRRPKTSSMNKDKKRDYKAYNRQGK